MLKYYWKGEVMKKNIKVISLLSILLLSGCGTNKEVLVTKCTSSQNNLQANYTLKSEYTIYSQKGVVNKVESVETINSSSEAILDYFDTYLTSTYEQANKVYGGYNNKVTKNDDEVISKTTIDYKSMDMNKYVEDNSVMKSYVNSKNELTLEGIKAAYQSIGATCE